MNPKELITTINTQLVVQKFRSHASKIFKYGLIGISAAILDFGIFALVLKAYSVSPLTSALASTTVANVCGISAGFLWCFFLQKNWAFQTQGNALTQFIFTLLLLIVNMAITSWAIPVVSDRFHITIQLSKIIMQIAVVGWNYLILNYLIFKHLGDKE